MPIFSVNVDIDYDELLYAVLDNPSLKTKLFQRMKMEETSLIFEGLSRYDIKFLQDHLADFGQDVFKKGDRVTANYLDELRYKLEAYK